MDRRSFIKAGGVTAAGAALGVLRTQSAEAQGLAARPVTLAGPVGHVDDDLDPRTSALAGFGADDPFQLDCQYRSVGVDLGRVQPFNAIRLATDTSSHRLNTRDLSVLTSNDNTRWTQHDSDFIDLGTTIWLYGFTARARYVKVHCYRDGSVTDATFTVSSLQELVTVQHVPAGGFIAGPGPWSYRVALHVSNPGRHTLRDRAAYLTLAELGAPDMIRQGRLAADLSDLRFADKRGRQLHAYNDGEGIFIRIPVIAAHGDLTIYAYSGCPGAQSVLSDSGALQIEYGRRTYQSQGGKSAAGLTFADELHPARLPDGTLLIAAATTAAGGIHARYSRDGGRTWSLPEPMIPASDPAAGGDRPGGFLVDPDTGDLIAIFYSVGVDTGADWTDPAQHLCQIWAARATRYVDSKPVFGTPQLVSLINGQTRQPVNYAITYCNPAKTSSGAYVVTVAYTFTPAGEFALTTLRSTDQGRSWEQSQSMLTLTGVGGLESGPTESTVTQLTSGELVIYTRQQSPEKFWFGTSTSRDDGVTWSPLSDTTILASNTAPCFVRTEGDLLLSWPGHNAFGQTSYRRNNLTVAYSTDETRSFHGYHDMTGATSLSTPGWYSGQGTRMIESFIVPAGDDGKDLLVATEGGLQSGAGSTLLIEDIHDYLHGSHGALDVIRHIEPGNHFDGTELAQSRWWNSSASGTLELVPGALPGRQAVRLVSTAGSQAGASRLFPGTRRGRVRFKLRAGELGSELRLALQEGYADGESLNVGANARGTVALFAIQPNGDILTTSDDVYSAYPVAGYIEDDTDPATGFLNAYSAAVAFDYDLRSVGVNLGTDDRTVTGLVLTGSTQYNASGVTRLEPSDLHVWMSADNASYQEVTGWSGTKDGLVITLSGPPITARYIKITQPYTDHAFTFANVMTSMIQVLPDDPSVEDPQRFSPLKVPTTLALGQWYTMQVDFDLDGSTVTTRVDGKVVSRLPVLHPAKTLTHLLLLPGADGVVDVSIDELMSQDLSQGLPVIRRLGPPA